MLSHVDPAPGVELRTTRGNDWTRALIGSAFMLLSLWAGATGFDLSPAQLSEVRGGGFIILLRDAIGDGGIRFLCYVGSYFSGAFAAGPIMRRIDGAPALASDEAGIQLHRSFGPGALPWKDVADIRLQERGPTELVISLNERFWAFETPLTSKRVRMNLTEIGCSYRAAEQAVQRMRRWKREAEGASSNR